MGLITILAVFVIAALLSVKWNEDFYDTFPMTVSGLILLLYILAFSQNLAKIDWICAGALVGIAVYCFREKQRKKIQVAGIGLEKATWSLLKAELFSAKSILLVVVMVVITFLVKDKVALWWDDINYWAVDAKALYYNGGFVGKYGNVAPEFGDYPPALQLFKWVFLHLFPDFKEGLMFGAYHCMNLIYTLPLLAKLHTKNPIYVLFGLIGIFLFPGIIDGIAQEGTCADVTMGLVYGAFLWAAYDEKEHKEFFYFLRMSLYLSVLVLTKSVGIEWVFFGVIFFFLMYTKRLKERSVSLKSKSKSLLLLCAAPLVTEGSWLLFCLLNRRVAKLTGAGVKIALSGDFTLPDNTMTKMGHFLRGFALYPMHLDRTLGIDMSSLAVLIFILVLIFLYKKIGVLAKWEMKRILVFVIVTAFAAYGIIFLGHLTIFAGELQYLDDAIMAKSIARYGAPFSAGLLYLLVGIFTNGRTALFLPKKVQSKITTEKYPLFAYGICFVFVLFTTSLPGAYQTLIGYRTTLEEDFAGRQSMVESDADLFLEKAKNLKAKSSEGDFVQEELFTKRILYLRDDHVIHWVKDTYVSYQAAPLPVVYGGIATDTMTEADMVQRIEESHAKYLYADKVAGDPEALFARMLNNEVFEYETFYKIIVENGVLRLEKLQ